MKQVVAEVLFWYGVLAFLFMAGYWFLVWVFDTPKDQAKQDMEEILKQADREVSQRKRVG